MSNVYIDDLKNFFAANGCLLTIGKHGIVDLSSEAGVLRAIESGDLMGISEFVAPHVAAAAEGAPAKRSGEVERLSVLIADIETDAIAEHLYDVIDGFDDANVERDGHSMYDGLKGCDINQPNVAAMLENALRTYIQANDDAEGELLNGGQVEVFESALNYQARKSPVWTALVTLVQTRAEEIFAAN